jgi:eukaryotic-like serine/threonine-protein kinase
MPRATGATMATKWKSEPSVQASRETLIEGSHTDIQVVEADVAVEPSAAVARDDVAADVRPGPLSSTWDQIEATGAEDAFDLTSRPPPRFASAPDIGTVVADKYVLEKLIGKGSMGAVYVARHELLDRHVALKFISEEHAETLDAARRFLNEARAAAGIENEHVARILDAGLLPGGAPYMVLEMLQGADLARLLEQALAAGRPLAIGRVVDWILQALEGIAEAHGLGIVHRDLKPANLFLASRRHGSNIVKVLDFGISKAARAVTASATLTATASLLGSPVYMAPEQLRDAKTVDRRADLWSLGVVLYELITGRLPFDAESVAEIFVAILERTPRPMAALRRDVPPELDRVVMRCLARDAEERFQDAAELADALAPFAPIGSYAGVRRIRHLTRHAWSRRESIPPPPMHRSRLAVVIVVLAIVAAAAVGLVESGIVTFGPRAAPPPSGASPAAAPAPIR